MHNLDIKMINEEHKRFKRELIRIYRTYEKHENIWAVVYFLCFVLFMIIEVIFFGGLRLGAGIFLGYFLYHIFTMRSKLRDKREFVEGCLAKEKLRETIFDQQRVINHLKREQKKKWKKK